LYSKKYEDLYNQGTIALNNRKPQEALNFFKKANKLVDDDPELFCNMGSTYLQLEEFEKGKECLNRAISYDPYNPITLLNFALILLMEGKYDEAIKTIEKILKHNPDFRQALPLLMQAKRQKEFFGSLKVEGKKIPKKALDLFKQGIKLTHRNKMSEALNAINSAIKIFPEFAEAYLYLGIINQMSQNQKSALDYFEKALKYDPKLFLAWVHKGWVYDSQNLFEKAIECYDRAIELNPNYSASYNNKGLALDSLERYDEAILSYSKSIEINPDFEGAYYNRATSYKKTNQLERALADYKKTLELNPNHENAKEQIDALKHFSTMGVEDTIRSVVDGRDYCPRCGKKNYTNSGICPHCRTPMHKENIEELLQTVVEEEAIGNFESALIKLIRINEREPTSGPAWFYRGKAHCALGEFKNAIMCFAKSQQLGFNPIQIMMYGLMAKNNISKFKRPDLSKRHLESVEAKHHGFFPDEKSWTANGAAQQMLMQYEEAYKCYQKALEIKNDFAPAKRNTEIIEKLSLKK